MSLIEYTFKKYPSIETIPTVGKWLYYIIVYYTVFTCTINKYVSMWMHFSYVLSWNTESTSIVIGGDVYVPVVFVLCRLQCGYGWISDTYLSPLPFIMYYKECDIIYNFMFLPAWIKPEAWNKQNNENNEPHEQWNYGQIKRSLAGKSKWSNAMFLFK